MVGGALATEMSPVRKNAKSHNFIDEVVNLEAKFEFKMYTY